MKYIRTKDGVYVLSEAYWAGNKDEILAEADTIEELCDEFVCVSKDNPKNYIIDDNLWGDVYPYYDSKKDYLYGAIWTSKGLIYVAKMDSEGKLVLI